MKFCQTFTVTIKERNQTFESYYQKYSLHLYTIVKYVHSQIMEALLYYSEYIIKFNLIFKKSSDIGKKTLTI